MNNNPKDQQPHDDQEPQPAAICGEQPCSETAIIGGENREPQPFDGVTLFGTFAFDDPGPKPADDLIPSDDLFPFDDRANQHKQEN